MLGDRVYAPAFGSRPPVNTPDPPSLRLACLGLAAPMHAPVVLRVSAFNVAAFNQNMCMRSGIVVFPFVHVCVDLVAAAPGVR